MKTARDPIRIADVPVEIRTRDLSNISKSLRPASTSFVFTVIMPGKNIFSPNTIKYPWNFGCKRLCDTEYK